MEIKCHCGNVTIIATNIPKEVAKCNCSICRRYATLWAYFKSEEIQISFRQEKSVFYKWGDGEIEFHRCNLCGCVTHYQSVPTSGYDRVGLNMNMAPASLLKTLPVRHIDGESY